MFQQPRKPPADARILRQRVVEERTTALVDHIKRSNHRDEYAVWENKTDAVIKRNAANSRYDKLQEQQQAALEARRQRLAELLSSEDRMYQQELAAQETTPEERRAALEQRALALFEKRETERQATAQEALYRQWREGCDGVRANDSAVITMSFAEQRRQQMVEKIGGRMAAAEESRYWHEVNEGEKYKKEMRHISDVEAARTRAAEAMTERDKQLIELAERRRAEAEEASAEVSALKVKWAAEEAAAAAKAQAAADKAAQIAEEVSVFNAHKRAQDAAKAAEERALDLQLVQEALRQAAEQEEREALVREAKKQGDEVYRMHLAMLAQKEKEDGAERERLIAEYQDIEHSKREELRRREEEARASLLREVMAENRRQLQEKAAARVAVEENKRLERQRYEQDKRVMGDEAAKQAAAQRAAVFLRKAELEAQIAAKEERKAAEQARRGVEAQMAREQEAVYQRLLEEERAKVMRNADPAKPVVPDFRRRKVAWYE